MLADISLRAVKAAAAFKPALSSQAGSKEVCSMSMSEDMLESLKLRYIEPSLSDGVRIAVYPDNEIEANSMQWNVTLIGYAMDCRPYNAYLKREMEKLWNVKGRLEVFPGENGLFLFKFSSYEECSRILDEGSWYFDNRLILPRRWEKGMREMEMLQRVPIWVKPHNLPLEWWSSDSLSRATSTIGKPLYMDGMTGRKERLGYACCCIQTGAAEKHGDMVTFSNSDGSVVHIQKCDTDDRGDSVYVNEMGDLMRRKCAAGGKGSTARSSFNKKRNFKVGKKKFAGVRGS